MYLFCEICHKNKCKLTVLRMDRKELPLKISATYFVDAKLHLFFRIVEEFIYGGSEVMRYHHPLKSLSSPIMVANKVVLKEHRTAKESWDAKQNREYLMSARQLATGDGEHGAHQGAFAVKAP